MNTKMVKFEEQKKEMDYFRLQKQEMDYFKLLATVASKGGTSNMPVDVLMNIMLTAKDLGISPMKAINGGFHVINGKISISTALMTDRIRKEGHSIKIPEWTSQKCVIIGVRKDNGDSIKFEYTIEDAQLAGLTVAATWKKFPKQMLYNRAMSTIARVLFSDVVGNSYSEDEKWDIMNVPPEDRPLEDIDAEISDPVTPSLELKPSLDSEIIQENEKINEEQVVQIIGLISKLDKASTESFFSWIKKTFNADSFEDIPASGFTRCMNSLNAKIKYLRDLEKSSEAEVA